MNGNRSGFGTYLSTQKLAKLQQKEAVIQLQKGDLKKAIHYLTAASENYSKALNNVAHAVWFSRRKKRGKKS